MRSHFNEMQQLRPGPDAVQVTSELVWHGKKLTAQQKSSTSHETPPAKKKKQSTKKTEQSCPGYVGYTRSGSPQMAKHVQYHATVVSNYLSQTDSQTVKNAADPDGLFCFSDTKLDRTSEQPLAQNTQTALQVQHCDKAVLTYSEAKRRPNRCGRLKNAMCWQQVQIVISAARVGCTRPDGLRLGGLQTTHYRQIEKSIVFLNSKLIIYWHSVPVQF